MYNSLRYRMFANLFDVDAIRKRYFFQSQTKRISNVICSVLLLVISPEAAAESESANLHVSARVVRGSCGVSPISVSFLNSDSQVIHKVNDRGVGNGLRVGCNTGSAGTMSLSIDANIAGNAVIRVVSNNKTGAETLKEAYLTNEGTHSQARHINLGLFPVAGPKVILIHSDSFIDNHVTTGVDERTMMLFINF